MATSLDSFDGEFADTVTNNIASTFDKLKAFYQETAAPVKRNFLSKEDIDSLLGDVDDLLNNNPIKPLPVKEAKQVKTKPPENKPLHTPPATPMPEARPATVVVKTEEKPTTKVAVTETEKTTTRKSSKKDTVKMPVKPKAGTETKESTKKVDLSPTLDIPNIKTVVESYLKFAVAIIATKIKGGGFEQPTYIKTLVNSWLVGAMPLLTNLELPSDKKSLRPTDRELSSLLNQFLQAKVDKKYEDLCLRLGAFMFTTKEQVLSNISLDQTLMLLYTNTYVQLKKWSPNSWKNINKNLNAIHDGNLMRYVNELTNSSVSNTAISAEQKPLAIELMKVVKALTGRDKSYQMTPNEKTDALNSTNKRTVALYEEYKRLYNEVRAIYRQKLMDVIRSSGKKFLPIDQVKKILRTKGVVVDCLPEGFVGGQIAEDGTLYTKEGVQINGCKTSTKITVSMNPKYDPKTDDSYVFSTNEEGRVGKSYYMTVNYRSEADAEKFDIVKELIDGLPRFRKIWMQDFKERGEWSEQRIIAGMIETVYQYQLRIGDPSNKTDGEETYGLSTLQKQHVTVKGENILEVNFRGKSGVGQTYVIDGNKNDDLKRIVKFIQTMLKGKTKADAYIFTFNNKRITAQKVNSYIKSNLGFARGTVHKFRHAKGTKMALEILNAANFTPEGNTIAKRQKAAEDWIKQNLFVKVAQALGHKKQTGEEMWQTSAKSYVAPELSHKFFKDLGLRSPKWIPKL